MSTRLGHVTATTADISPLIRLDDDEIPFSRSSMRDLFWGYRVRAYQDGPTTQYDVWVRNPLLDANDDGDAFASWDDLRDDKGVLIEIDDGEEEGWADDLYDAVLEDLHLT